MKRLPLRQFLHTAALGTGLALSALAFTATANAQMPAAGHSGHAGMAQPASADANASPSTKAFQASGEEMMQGMNAPYTGNADQDFAAQMIAHHQGAVSMARVELEYGKDPEMRKLARDIIQAQKKEIAFMKKWQAKHGGKGH